MVQNTVIRMIIQIVQFKFKFKLRTLPLVWKQSNAVVTPLRKAASYMYEPRIAIWGIWGNTASTWQYVVVTGPLQGLHDASWKLLLRKISPFYCRVSYVAVTRILSLMLRNTWHYVIIRRQKFWFPKFVLCCSYFTQKCDHGISLLVLNCELTSKKTFSNSRSTEGYLHVLLMGGCDIVSLTIGDSQWLHQ